MAKRWTAWRIGWITSENPLRWVNDHTAEAAYFKFSLSLSYVCQSLEINLWRNGTCVTLLTYFKYVLKLSMQVASVQLQRNRGQCTVQIGSWVSRVNFRRWNELFHIDPIPGTRRPSCSAMKLHSSENESETNYSAAQQFSDFCPKNRPRRTSYANEGISYANESAIRRFPDQGDRLKDPTLQPSPTGQPLATGAIKCNLFFATKQPPNNPLRNPLRQRKIVFQISSILTIWW